MWPYYVEQAGYAGEHEPRPLMNIVPHAHGLHMFRLQRFANKVLLDDCGQEQILENGESKSKMPHSITLPRNFQKKPTTIIWPDYHEERADDYSSPKRGWKEIIYGELKRIEMGNERKLAVLRTRSQSWLLEQKKLLQFVGN